MNGELIYKQPINSLNLSQHKTLKSIIARFIGSVGIAGCISFTLLVIMSKLIEQDLAPISEQPRISFTTSILQIDEKPIREIQRIKPKPPALVQPKLVREAPRTTKNNNNVVTLISLPSTKIQKLSFNPDNFDKEPTPLVRVDPRYPVTAANQGIEGFVELIFNINKEGKVENIHILHSEPKRVFDKAAKDALRKWRYQPRIVNKKAVNTNDVKVRLDFTLAK